MLYSIAVYLEKSKQVFQRHGLPSYSVFRFHLWCILERHRYTLLQVPLNQEPNFAAYESRTQSWGFNFNRGFSLDACASLLRIFWMAGYRAPHNAIPAWYVRHLSLEDHISKLVCIKSCPYDYERGLESTFKKNCW